MQFQFQNLRLIRLETTLKIKTNGSTTLVLSSITKENFKQIVQKELAKIVDSVSENTEIFEN